MKKFISCLAVLVLLCSSCANDLPEMVSSEQNNAPKTDLDYALAYAEELINQLDPQTRGVSRKANVQFVCNEATRAGEQDTLLYLVNYDDNMGFALLDAECKNGGVYAISPKGHLEFADSINNPILGFFFNRVKTVSAIHEPQTRDLTGGIIGWNKPHFLTIEEYGPHLNDWVSSWKGEKITGIGPYGYADKATTAAVAISKLMAFYRCPTPVLGNTFDWSTIIDSQNQIGVESLILLVNHPIFLRDVTMPDIGTYGAGDENRKVTPSLVESALQNLNFPYMYLKVGMTNPFGSNEDITLKVLNGKIFDDGIGVPFIAGARPVGQDNYAKTYYQFWVIDGYIKRVSIPENISQPTLYHCCWGKEGYQDGYYSYARSFNKLTDYKYNSSKDMPDQMLFPNTQITGGCQKSKQTGPAVE